jgi:sugar lactone lactonase YvrE
MTALCVLGEGAIWHPARGQLFWFDITSGKLLSRKGEEALSWQFDRCVSAAGWIDEDHLLIAGETGLTRFSLATGRDEMICAIEANRPETRSNDGRADPWGGFWVGTMAKGGEAGAGRLYRWFKGTLRELRSGMTTPNAICFAPDRSCAYYADTRERMILRHPLDPQSGWPVGEPALFIDLRRTSSAPEYKPDGAVIDSEGCLWNAQWGASRVARYDPDGMFIDSIELPTGHCSCPAFGGADLSTLFVTTAQEKIPDNKPAWRAMAGQTFVVTTGHTGMPEPRIVL